LKFSKIASPTSQENQNSAKNDLFCLFELEALFPGRKLLVNVSKSIISLLPGDGDQYEYVIAQHILTEAEMRMLLPLLENPTCCQQAVLQASYSCTYEVLLQSLLFSDANTNPQWKELVQQQRTRLQHAQQRKAQRTEMRAVYNALFGLRHKLEQLGLTVRSRRDGYYLALLVEEKLEEEKHHDTR
jgi:hypothetical protein